MGKFRGRDSGSGYSLPKNLIEINRCNGYVLFLDFVFPLVPCCV